jgi:type I restriction enzyme, R subunit
MTEADTCREFVPPRLAAAGWSAAESVIGEQHSFTNGRIIVAGGKVRRGKQRRADYLLYYRRDSPLAVVEAKKLGLPATLERVFAASSQPRRPESPHPARAS